MAVCYTHTMRFLLFSWLLLLPVIFGNSQSLKDQSSLLFQLKQSLSSTTKTSKLTSWNLSTDCCSWNGVICDKVGRLVIGLDLSDEVITSGIDNSSSLFNLSDLQILNLANNTFNYTSIPSGFGRLANLTHLNLSQSGFTGQIPIEISHLTRLVSLDLSAVNFPGQLSLKLEDPNLRMLVQNLSGLRELRLDGVNISAQGSEWCQALSSSLSNLQVLSLSSCYISGPLDSSLSKLHLLSEIRLDKNNLSDVVPDFFANFFNLTSLHLGTCGLHGIFPEKIFQVKALKNLDISKNPLLQGSLPEFPRNASLQTLELSNTNFSGNLTDSIGYLRFLSKLELAHCNFGGSIPPSMANLAQLVKLDLSSNRFTGSIPWFSLSKNLTKINLAHNCLTSPIPSTYWDKLVSLELQNNSLDGEIPSSLFSLPSLQQLHLARNNLTGHLEEFLNVPHSSLVTLDLSSNKLKGPIPVWVFELQSLKVLTLSFNNFSGTLQLYMIQKLGNLSSLDLSYNSLLINASSGNSTMSSFPMISTLLLASCNLREFPDFLKNQMKLNLLDLSNNQIHGGIPNWIWKVGNRTLRHLNLSHNLLEYLEQPFPNPPYSVLAILDLNSNLLRGPIPIPPPTASYLDYSNNMFNSSILANVGSYLSFVVFFSLSSNNLTGEIPQSICNMSSFLQVLDLSNNRLDGPIPPCLGNMGSILRVLNLRRNNLGGTMPQTFPSGCKLRTIDLNANKLVGRVSTTLANCVELEVLDLGNNKINDSFPFSLGTLSQLRVLVLRSNRFHGPIRHPETNCTFPMLQIIDLSSNDFMGDFPLECFRSWKEMMADKDKSQSNLKHMILRVGVLQLSQLYYQDMVTVTGKGLELELVKILTVFTCIDFSKNRFQEKIPEVIGNLTSLIMLNLSGNYLTGSIPSSLGNLKQLESLDLSNNRLNGMIPTQLASLTFLSVLNLSWNFLEGMIPQGTQFQTFSNSSFKGNDGLCGLPLSSKCKDTEMAPPPTTKFVPRDSKSVIEFDQEFISTGLGFGAGAGAGAGMVVAPLMFWKKGRKWYNEHIDWFLFTILQLAGLSCTNCDERRTEEEKNIEEKPMEMTGDYDDEEEDGEGCCARFCVFCSKLDNNGKMVIHSPNCSCHKSPPIYNPSL